VFEGFNDSPHHTKELSRILNKIPCRINLIHFHPVPGTPLSVASQETMEKFQAGLIAKGITTTIRKSRGENINAACGLLSTKEILKNRKEGVFECLKA
jgi:23S rRNA (adenine2503-C2)-methyltransferase